MYDTKSPEKNYHLLKKLLANTPVASYFDDNYSFAYIENEKQLPSGADFVSFSTACNRCHVISFVKDGDNIYTKFGSVSNYGNYECRCDDNGVIHEVNNFGFGSSKETLYDLKFNKLSEKLKREFGSCCD